MVRHLANSPRPLHGELAGRRAGAGQAAARKKSHDMMATRRPAASTPRATRLDDLGLPELGPHEVQMKLGAGGICGSDLHYFGHGRVGAFVIREPLVPGHGPRASSSASAQRSRA
jgi:hypothetical protein